VIEARVFRAMGTDIELLVRLSNGDASDAFDAVEAEFERLEQLMSRFRPDSELSQLNRAGALEVSAELAQVIELALAAREGTAGRFDPCVHDALVAAGYDRTFAEVAPDGADTAQVEPVCGGEVSVDGCRVELEDGAKLDLGGIGKGYAAERAADILAAAGPCLVDAGGDVAVRGGHAWPVGVETGEGVVTLALERGALATSGSDRRRWTRDGEERHHLIDPRTGRSAETDILRVTAFADDAVQAEVLAKLLFLAGANEAAERNATAIVVTRSGETILTGGFA
jgi:thiamine biosynthesis lipoprotein